MTDLLERAIEDLTKLPESEQDRCAAMILAQLYRQSGAISAVPTGRLRRAMKDADEGKNFIYVNSVKEMFQRLKL